MDPVITGSITVFKAYRTVRKQLENSYKTVTKQIYQLQKQLYQLQNSYTSYKTVTPYIKPKYSNRSMTTLIFCSFFCWISARTFALSFGCFVWWHAFWFHSCTLHERSHVLFICFLYVGMWTCVTESLCHVSWPVYLKSSSKRNLYQKQFQEKSPPTKIKLY